MSDTDTVNEAPATGPDTVNGAVTFTLPEGTKVTAPRHLAETLGWKPGDTAPARRGKK